MRASRQPATDPDDRLGPADPPPGRVVVENVNHPGRTTTLDAQKYGVVRDALLEALPPKAPGLTQDEMVEGVKARLPQELFPNGERAGWWTKSVQLDLEAKGLVDREASKPLRWHRRDLTARASVLIGAGRDGVWEALVDPVAIKQYMFGATVVTDWQEGGTILWRGEWQGEKFEDRGKILRFEPGSLLRFTHFSPLSGRPDRPENYHTVTIQLSSEGDGTRVELQQDNNATGEARGHSEENWKKMLDTLREYVED